MKDHTKSDVKVIDGRIVPLIRKDHKRQHKHVGVTFLPHKGFGISLSTLIFKSSYFCLRRKTVTTALFWFLFNYE